MVMIGEIPYDHACRKCKLWQNAEDVCEPGFSLRDEASILVVSRMPNSRTYQNMIEEELHAAGIDVTQCFFTAALKCRNFEQSAGKGDQKACASYLDAEINAIKPTWILAFGNEALYAATGHSGIMKYRGRVLERRDGPKIVATISPAAVNRNPGQMQSWRGDLQFFAAQVAGRASLVQPPKVRVIHTPERLVELRQNLVNAQLISYDVETAGNGEFTPESFIVSLSGTCEFADGSTWTFALPLYHPQSPFQATWLGVLDYLNRDWQTIPKQIAHNGKYDARWLRHFGLHAKVTFDTMLAAHILDENRIKGLKPLARILLGVPDWGIDTKDLLSTPLKPILKYNALDVWHTYHIYKVLREQLIAEPRLLRLFVLLLMPANERLIEIERRGIWIDPEKLATASKIANDMRHELDDKLMQFVPDPEEPGSSIYAESDAPWPTMGRRGKKAEVNFNATKFSRWWIFEHLGFPVIERGKEKDDGSPGDPSLREAVMMELAESGHEVPKLLLERVKWQKYATAFLPPYQALADSNNRLHTSFKLFGTVTGRLSSGKEEQEKLTARRGKRPGFNIQQVPRDKLIRGLFGAPPGWWFVEADYSQAEMRIAGWMARDPVIMQIYRMGGDIHKTMAMKMTGKPPSAITADDRKRAKPVNFGYLFGMWWKKFIQTAWENYGVRFTEAEARASRKTFFDTYPRLEAWHRRQRRLVRKFGRVINPIGRIRHLPDIYSTDQQVQQEAERQAINSPVQSFASDMNTLAMILIAEAFEREGIQGHCLGLVHDSNLMEVKDEDLARALPIIKQTMENLPLQRMFNVRIGVPIVADVKVGHYWSEGKEIEAKHIRRFEKYRHLYLED